MTLERWLLWPLVLAAFIGADWHDYVLVLLGAVLLNSLRAMRGWRLLAEDTATALLRCDEALARARAQLDRVT